VNAQDSKAEIFDVFLCHNSEDKPAVREIAQKLIRQGIKPWLDEKEIRPGTSWQTALGEQIKSIKSAAVFVGNSGIGPWQNQEIQALLSQFVKRKCPVIPVVLPSAKTTPDLPWTLENLHSVDFRMTNLDPLKQLIWGITGEKPAGLSDVFAPERPANMQEAAESRLVLGRDAKAAQRKVICEARLCPALAVPPDQEQVVQLKILRSRVTEYWVDGLLKHSLYNEVLISLGRREIGKAVDAPWKYSVELSDATASAPLDDRDVSAIYDATGLLLILGEPGSGKTTTLLDLAWTLLERARDDIKERVPIVLNLSSWKKKQPLAEWISGELSEKYRVPVKIARSWLQNDYLVPLLDGLDEVPTALQADCVAAINDFIDGSEPSGIVVCCRLMEYQWLPKRLKLNGAICLESLSSEEVSNYLARGGSKLATLRVAVNTDPVLHELAQTPLMLSIMSLAFQGVGGNELAKQNGNSLDDRRKQIFGLYVEQMFQRKGTTSLLFPKEKVIGWLSWLAGKMREHSQSVFLVEGLQPNWLGTIAKTESYGTVVFLICFLMGVLIGGIIGTLVGGTIVGVGGLIGGVNGGLLGGGLGGFAGGSPRLGGGSLNHIALAETISWKWNQFWKRAIGGMIVGPLFVLIGGLIVGRSVGLIGVLVLIVKLISGGLILFGLENALAGGFTDSVKVGKASPNQGIKLSLKNSLVVFLVTSLTIGLIVGLIVGLIFHDLSAGVIVGPIVGLYAGLIVGLNRGGSAVIKHYVLRLILWRSGHTPFKFIQFLDHCARLIFLKKVGGGYIFIHRMLLDYFAEMTPQSTRVEDGKAGSVGR
jgi:hypothetical protein